MDNYGNLNVGVGAVVEYVDPVSVSHDALITAVWGSDDDSLGKHAVNLVYVVSETDKTDSCGRQIERATSVSPEGPSTAHGRFYRLK